MSTTLEDHTVVVIGGSSGLGYATAAAARHAGADVVLVARDAQRLAEASDALGGSLRTYALDAADADAVEAMAGELDRVDHVASFTGGQPEGPARATTYDDFVTAFASRVWAARNLCSFLAPKMPSSGSFTFCSGLVSWRPRAGKALGGSAGAAIEAYARGMAVDLAPIRVNTVCPGTFDTPVLDRVFGERKQEAMARHTSTLPAGRVGDPSEMGQAVVGLMTNGYISGTVLHIDGGSLLI